MILNFSGIVLSVILFINSSILFSENVKGLVGRRIKKSINVFEKKPLRGLIFGTVSTSILQSSTASSILIASLVNSSILTFKSSVPLILGMNIGTTITSQLIAFKFFNFSPFLLLFGIIVHYFGRGLKKYSKAIINFSLIFLSIFFISFFIEKTDIHLFTDLVANLENLFLLIFIGVILTTVFQSSSFISGLVLALSFSSILNLPQAIALILGAKIGTTSSVILATLSMNKEAKRVALSHFLFNFFSVILVIPLLPLFFKLAPIISDQLPLQIVFLQLIITVFCALFFLILIKPFTKLLSFIIKSD